MLALFEVLSFKGWLDVRDVLIKVLGPVSSSGLLVSQLFEVLNVCVMQHAV